MSHNFSVSGVFSAMEVAASGLTAERGRMNIIAGNLANGSGGGLYAGKTPIVEGSTIAGNHPDDTAVARR